MSALNTIIRIRRIVEILNARVGGEPIKGTEIAKLMEAKTGEYVCKSTVEKLIFFLRDFGEVPIEANRYGYFVRERIDFLALIDLMTE